MEAPTISGGVHHLPGLRGCPGSVGVLGLSKGPRALAAASAAFVRVLIIVRFFSASGGDFRLALPGGALCIRTS